MWTITERVQTGAQYSKIGKNKTKIKSCNYLFNKLFCIFKPNEIQKQKSDDYGAHKSASYIRYYQKTSQN